MDEGIYQGSIQPVYQDLLLSFDLTQEKEKRTDDNNFVNQVNPFLAASDETSLDKKDFLGPHRNPFLLTAGGIDGLALLPAPRWNLGRRNV